MFQGISFDWPRGDCDKGFLNDMYRECEERAARHDPVAAKKKETGEQDATDILDEENFDNKPTSNSLEREFRILDKRMKESKEKSKRVQRSVVKEQRSKKEAHSSHHSKKKGHVSKERSAEAEKEEEVESVDKKNAVEAEDDQMEKKASSKDSIEEAKESKVTEVKERKETSKVEKKERKDKTAKNSKRKSSVLTHDNLEVKGYAKKKRVSKFRVQKSKCGGSSRKRGCGCHQSKKQLQEKTYETWPQAGRDDKSRHERIIQILTWLDDLLKLEKQNYTQPTTRKAKMQTKSSGRHQETVKESKDKDQEHKTSDKIKKKSTKETIKKTAEKKTVKANEDRETEKKDSGSEDNGSKDIGSKDNGSKESRSEDRGSEDRGSEMQSKATKRRSKKHHVLLHETRKRFINQCKVSAHLYFLAVSAFAQKFYRKKAADWCKAPCVQTNGKPNIKKMRKPRKLM